MEEFNFGKTSYPTQILVKSHLPVGPAVGEVLHQYGEHQGGHDNDAALPGHGGTALACTGVRTAGRHSTKFFDVGKDWQIQIVSGFSSI